MFVDLRSKEFVWPHKLHTLVEIAEIAVPIFQFGEKRKILDFTCGEVKTEICKDKTIGGAKMVVTKKN